MDRDIHQEQELDIKLCRLCGGELGPGHERAIGVHTYCLYEHEMRQTIRIPRPRYGRTDSTELS